MTKSWAEVFWGEVLAASDRFGPRFRIHVEVEERNFYVMRMRIQHSGRSFGIDFAYSSHELESGDALVYQTAARKLKSLRLAAIVDA